MTDKSYSFFPRYTSKNSTSTKINSSVTNKSIKDVDKKIK